MILVQQGCSIIQHQNSDFSEVIVTRIDGNVFKKYQGAPAVLDHLFQALTAVLDHLFQALTAVLDQLLQVLTAILDHLFQALTAAK